MEKKNKILIKWIGNQSWVRTDYTLAQTIREFDRKVIRSQRSTAYLHDVHVLNLCVDEVEVHVML